MGIFRLRGPVERSGTGETETLSLKQKLARGVGNGMIVALAATSLTHPLDLYSPGTAAIQAPLSTGHGRTPLGMDIDRAVLKAAHSTVGPEDISTFGAVDPDVKVGNEAIYADQADAIAHAQSEVLFQTYWYTRGGNTEALMHGLAELETHREHDAAPGSEPVHVYMGVDDTRESTRVAQNGFQSTGTSRQDQLDADIAALHLDPRFVTVKTVGLDHTLTGASHAKSLIVDRTIAKLTGANPQFEDGYPQMDLGWTVRGNAVHALWADAAATLHHSDPSIRLTDGTWPTPRYAGDQVPMVFAAKQANGAPWPEYNNPIVAGEKAMLANAKQVVRFISPNLNAKPEVEAMLDAARSGTTVQVLLSKDFNQDIEGEILQGGPNDEVAKQMYATLKAEGQGKEQFLQIRWFSHNGEYAAVPGQSSHAKYASADGKVAMMRTANDDTQSAGHSHEIGLFVDDEQTTQHLDETCFLPYWNQGVAVS